MQSSLLPNQADPPSHISLYEPIWLSDLFSEQEMLELALEKNLPFRFGKGGKSLMAT